MSSIQSILATSFISWIIVAYLLARFKSVLKIPMSSTWVFLGTLVVGMLVTGVGTSLLTSSLVSSSSSSASASSSGSLGVISLLPVSGGGNFTIQDKSNKLQCNVEANAALIDTDSTSDGGEFNCTFTIQRVGPLQAASFNVMLKDNPSYINPYDDTDDKTYYVLARDTFKNPKLYFDSTTYQGSKVVGFAEGASSATLTAFADITKKDFNNISNYGTKSLSIDICGQATLPILIRRTN